MGKVKGANVSHFDRKTIGDCNKIDHLLCRSTAFHLLTCLQA